jgi:hypothetical protein
VRTNPQRVERDAKTRGEAFATFNLPALIFLIILDDKVATLFGKVLEATVEARSPLSRFGVIVHRQQPDARCLIK